MALEPITTKPKRNSYDVVIIGGGIMGSSTAWFLSKMDDFNGTVLVVERDPTYAFASTSHTNSCMRQQFSTELNIRISQFAAEFVKNLRAHLGGDPRVPELGIRSFGYLYLADTPEFAAILKHNQMVQHRAGTPTEILQPSEIIERYPFYNMDDIILGSINTVDEGYWDGATVFDWQKRLARENGVEYVSSEVVSLNLSPLNGKVDSVMLSDGEAISCGQVVNAAGPRAAQLASMIGIDLPVEPRKRFTWVFKAEKPLDRDLPLTIDPSGVHVRENGGGTYQAGGHLEIDEAVEFDDFDMDHSFWGDHVWPVLAARIPQFEAIKVQTEWAGHYAMNYFDHNAITGPHPEISNFLFLNGFSGHGLQQSPAMGRGTAEWLTFGRYKSLDLSPFHFDRILEGNPVEEVAVI